MAVIIQTRETVKRTSKGTISVQTHGGNTTKVTTSTPATMSEVRGALDSPEVESTVTQTGDVTEVKTSSGNGTDTTIDTTSTKENKGFTVTFEIPIQQKNPVTLV